MQAPLQIRLFGVLDLRLGETPLSLESARAASLLAFLLVHRAAPHTRRSIAFQLWPDSTDAQAQTNLRHVLHTLRRALPDSDRYIEVTTQTLRWRGDSGYRLDIADFDAALARADVGDHDVDALRAAVAVYAGDLLHGVYDEWLAGPREEYRRRYLAALARLADLLAARGESTEALLLAERLLLQDPLDEHAWRLLMRLHHARGDRARALRTYHACVSTLERELGVEPAVATRDAYTALLAAGQDRQPATASGQVAPERPPLVGRTAAWAQLLTIWQTAEEGEARCVLLTGEAGSGKTRLIEELRDWCTHHGATVAEGRSYAAEGALAYGPVVSWLRAKALRGYAARLGPAQRGELARLLPEMPGADPHLVPPPPLPEADQRQRLYDALAQALLAGDAPLLLIADDLHWCDRETLGFLHYLLRIAPRARLFLAATARTEELEARPVLREFLNGLRAAERLDELELGPLQREETLILAERIAGRGLSNPAGNRLYTTTEGNPLFIIEAVRAGWGDDTPSQATLTPRVQAVIESRLGQVSAEARDLAGVAATIGRAFSVDVLRAATGADEDELVRVLDELWHRRIIRERDMDAYDFSHPLILEVAYRTGGPAQRRQRHARIARALERLHAADPSPVSGQIAAHYDRGGIYDAAVSWYRQAAGAAARVYAHAETVRLLERGADLLREQPTIPNRELRELELLAALPGPLLAIEGYRSERLSAAQQRALTLAEAHGRDIDPPLLRSLGLSALAQEEFEQSREFARILYARGERNADPLLLIEADYLSGVAAYWSGELAEAQRAFEAVVRRYRPERRQEHLLHYGQDPYIVCRTRLAHTLWLRGFPERAAGMRDETLALAEELAHPYSYAVGHAFALLLTIEMRDIPRVRELLALPIGRETGVGLHLIQLNLQLFSELLAVLDGRVDEGIQRMQQSLDDPRRLNDAPGMRSFFLRVLLEACRIGNRPAAGLAAADELLAHTHLWDSEALRLRAEFAMQLGLPPQQALADLTAALTTATRQGALLPRVRAATALLQFHLQHGPPAATSTAQRRLAAALGELTEGRHLDEVRTATALLHAR